MTLEHLQELVIQTAYYLVSFGFTSVLISSHLHFCFLQSHTRILFYTPHSFLDEQSVLGALLDKSYKCMVEDILQLLYLSCL